MLKARRILLQGFDLPRRLRDRGVVECVVDGLGNVHILLSDDGGEELGPVIGKMVGDVFVAVE